jgi:hypothetical protein
MNLKKTHEWILDVESHVGKICLLQTTKNSGISLVVSWGAPKEIKPHKDNKYKLREPARCFVQMYISAAEVADFTEVTEYEKMHELTAMVIQQQFKVENNG